MYTNKIIPHITVKKCVRLLTKKRKVKVNGTFLLSFLVQGIDVGQPRLPIQYSLCCIFIESTQSTFIDHPFISISFETLTLDSFSRHHSEFLAALALLNIYLVRTCTLSIRMSAQIRSTAALAHLMAR